VSAPKVVVFDRDWSEPHDGTGERGEARVYTLAVGTDGRWLPGILEDLERGAPGPLWDLLSELDQEHVDYDPAPRREDWAGYWVLHVAPAGASVRAEAP
jgi:hypothetical protein